MHTKHTQFVPLITKQCASFCKLTCAKNRRSVSRFRVNAKLKECAAAGVSVQWTEHTTNGGKQILLTLVSNVLGQLLTNSSHGVATSSKPCKITGFKRTAPMQDNSTLWIGGDLTRSQGSAIGKHFKITGKICSECRDCYEITAISCIQLRHWRHNARLQKCVPACGFLNDVRSKYLRYDDVTTQGSHR